MISEYLGLLTNYSGFSSIGLILIGCFILLLLILFSRRG